MKECVIYVEELLKCPIYLIEDKFGTFKQLIGTIELIGVTQEEPTPMKKIYRKTSEVPSTLESRHKRKKTQIQKEIASVINLDEPEPIGDGEIQKYICELLKEIFEDSDEYPYEV